MTTPLLPLHPFARHPHPGQPIRAVYLDKSGRARYPIMGAGPEEDAAAEKVAADAAAEEAVTAAAKADADTAAANEAAKDNGFPKDTPRAQMKPSEQTAYDAFHGRKHEQRATEYREAAGGKTAAELKADMAELATLRTSQLTDGEKAVATAKAEGRREASLAVAPQMFDVALAHVDEDRRKVLIDSIDLSKVIKEDGTVDTAKVKIIAENLAPADKEPGRQHDYGAGRRESVTKSGVAAGSDMYAASRSKSSTTTQ